MFPRPASVSRVSDSERCLDCKTWEIIRADSGLLAIGNSGVWGCPERRGPAFLR